MFKYESKDGEKEVEVESVTLVAADSELAIFLSRYLQAIHAVVPLDHFEFTRQGMTDPAVYFYDITPVDLGAQPVWQQTLTFLPGNQVRHTFDIPAPGWQEAAFVLQRPLRALLIKHVASHGITRVDVKWA